MNLDYYVDSYQCCLNWVGIDCYLSAGNHTCFDYELQPMNKMLNIMIMLDGAGDCKDYKYTKGLTTCTK
ncbi:unnamed protein product [Oppiella nova]|uniref:Uncharacterized protein n=1 Tax=Oppiella nova TaxID=334625 RepID=A0A7R9LAT1_9ACAR|nr:unnamed protein product [Oppiella nova]CAG2161620.1 unnamed protein product [Oppiella nova]